MTTALKETVGRYGIWSVGLRSEDPAKRAEIAEAAAELEQLGYGAVWLGGSSAAHHSVPLLEATSRLTVGTSIQSIWQYDAEASAAGFAEVDAAHPGRFVLGLGVSHAKLADQYRRPYSALVAYLDALDAAGVPAERRVLAALGPKTLQLSADRAAGAIPYLVTPEHTAQARAILGEAPLLSPSSRSSRRPTRPVPAPWPARPSPCTSPSPTTRTASCASASPRTTWPTAAATA